ncbi:MAG: T9SS type A sorting domain-containing protein [Bacteroidia bacterium]|nr:T9SS type A sorting domain-containing protein [Bacteroidia bacterium]
MATTTHYAQLIAGFLLFTIVQKGSAQPLFYLPDGPSPCPGEVVQVDMVVPDIFDTYTWDLGNGITHQGYQPPFISYEEEGTYTLSLTVSDNTPFRVIDKITVTQINNVWDDAGDCDNRPDLYLSTYNSSGATHHFSAPVNYNQSPPVEFTMNGVLAHTDFRVAVWEYDLMIAWPFCWDLSSENLGYVLVPANYPGGTLSQAANNLEVVITTKMVTTTTFHRNIKLTEGFPIITCHNDTLDSGDSTATAWYNTQDQLVGSGQKFRPSLPGDYYVERVSGTCKPRSEAISWPCSGATAIEKVKPVANLKIYPNPSDGQVIVEMPEVSGNPEVEIRISDLAGREQHRENMPYQSSLSLNLVFLPAGTYLVHIRSEGQSFTGKLVKMN